MIKKIGIVLFSLLLSFFVLEGLSTLSQRDCKEEGTVFNSLSKKNIKQCPYKYKPYKKIVYDFIAKDVSTNVAVAAVAPNFFELGNLDLHLEEGDEVIKPAVVKKTIANADKKKKPKIVIVIDDMGISRKRTLDIISLKAPITLSFLTYSNGLEEYFKMLEGSKFEIMGHIPMEAKTKFDEAPDTLRVSFSNKRVSEEFEAMLKNFNKINFVNNHTGSLFTENKEKMSAIMKVLKKHNVGFLDSKTSSNSVGEDVAKECGVEYFARNVFLDNKNDFDYIIKQLEQTERIAKKYGYAIAIGHPKSQTYEALKHWLATQKDFEVVNLRDLSF